MVTNHYICDFSYDENNNRINVPMTIFSDGRTGDPNTGERIGLNGSSMRFWTLMWDIKHHYGRIDKYRSQQIMSGFYGYDTDTGEKIEVLKDKKKMFGVFMGIFGPVPWGGYQRVQELAMLKSLLYRRKIYLLIGP